MWRTAIAKSNSSNSFVAQLEPLLDAEVEIEPAPVDAAPPAGPCTTN